VLTRFDSVLSEVDSGYPPSRALVAHGRPDFGAKGDVALMR